MTSRYTPIEIFTEILSHISENDRQTLLACLLTNRSLYDIASLSLYRTITLSSHSQHSPFHDVETVSDICPLARCQVLLKEAGRSRKRHLLNLAKVLELDGRMGGPFRAVKGDRLRLPSIRTLRVDMSNGRSPVSWGQESRYSSLRGIKPKTIVIKHLSFHGTTCILDLTPKSVLSHISRIIYIIEYKDRDVQFGRANGPSNLIHSFGLHQWLGSLRPAPLTLTTVDIVFWNPSASPNFSTPSNRYTYIRHPVGKTWLDTYFTHIAKQAILSSGQIKFNFVNTGSFDRDAVAVDECEYEVVQKKVREKLLKAIGPTNGEGFGSLSLMEWLEDMRAGGVMIGDVLTDEERRII